MSGRSSTHIMLSVWKALLLREATFRLFGTRAAWAWLLLEPLSHFAFLTFLFAIVRQRVVGGIDVAIWLILGLIGFFTFRRTANQMGGAIDSNLALFTYRQVLPFDAIVVRGVLEGLIMLVAFILVTLVMALIGYDVVPDRPLMVLGGFFGLWLLGGSLGLAVAVGGVIVEETRQIFSMLMMPLYFISGVIFPLSAVPPQYREILMLNPVVHGVEAMRAGFSTYYHASDGLDLSYLYLCALCLLALGLTLYTRFAKAIETT
ncbi:ABC transporter permease [Erythrobacteraceae bacterium E2-1 Yellow Sea]|nr:ABC transporter permease [Erythrobacteraceae bacterium E2-1 Yellow Sea]